MNLPVTSPSNPRSPISFLKLPFWTSLPPSHPTQVRPSVRRQPPQKVKSPYTGLLIGAFPFWCIWTKRWLCFHYLTDIEGFPQADLVTVWFTEKTTLLLIVWGYQVVSYFHAPFATLPSARSTISPLIVSSHTPRSSEQNKGGKSQAR